MEADLADEKKMGGEVEAEELGLGHREKAEEMTPWEQHSKVISIPRFDYTAPSSLLERSRSGFLITCPIKREKSATKEAISILEKYAGITDDNDNDNIVTAKRRKVNPNKTDAGYIQGVGTKETRNILEPCHKGDVTKEVCKPTCVEDECTERSLSLSLVKLTRSGLLLFTFPSNIICQTVDMVSHIFQSLESGNLKKPLWCHRILPIQETCVLVEEDLRQVVTKLFQEYLANNKDELEASIKFAVGFNRRGLYEAGVKLQKNTTESNGPALLDREKCLGVVAGAVKAVAKDSVVDLKSPKVAVLVELLPLSGVPHGSLVAGVSVLPHYLVTAKPRLGVKALVADSKATKIKS